MHLGWRTSSKEELLPGEQLQISCTRQEKGLVMSWIKLKRLLKSRFLPSNFEQRLFRQYQDCRKGSRSVQAYVDELYRLSAHDDLMETKAQQVQRFVGGLCVAIQDKVSMHPMFTFNKSCQSSDPCKDAIGTDYSVSS